MRHSKCYGHFHKHDVCESLKCSQDMFPSILSRRVQSSRCREATNRLLQYSGAGKRRGAFQGLVHRPPTMHATKKPSLASNFQDVHAGNSWYNSSTASSIRELPDNKAHPWETKGLLSAALKPSWNTVAPSPVDSRILIRGSKELAADVATGQDESSTLMQPGTGAQRPH